VKTAGIRLYRTRAFAERAGVTVRTLHHYDRLGLLNPTGRSPAGHRLYSDADLARLQQVVTLKFLGFPLERIKELLESSALDLPAALRVQRRIVEEKRRHLTAVLEALGAAERVSASINGERSAALTKIIEVVNMANEWTWARSYYTEEQLQQLAARATPGVLAKGEQDWADLIRDVEASLDEDPAGEKAQALAARWAALIEAFTGGDPGIRESLGKLYADQANWPATATKPYSDAAEAFIKQAQEARKAGGA
jgi:DNA-binding transcriptional MerR regulator